MNTVVPFLVMSVVGLGVIGFLLIILARLLAEFDLFFTFVGEGRAKAILLNGKFHRAVISYRGHGFRVSVDSRWRDKLFQEKEGLEKEVARPETTEERRRIIQIRIEEIVKEEDRLSDGILSRSRQKNITSPGP